MAVVGTITGVAKGYAVPKEIPKPQKRAEEAVRRYRAGFGDETPDRGTRGSQNQGVAVFGHCDVLAHRGISFQVAWRL